jgi:hypothetical protein
MKRTAFLLVLAATVAAAACLQKDTSSTIYLRRDGSFTWVIHEQNVRSDAADEASRAAEELGYADDISGGGESMVNGLLALGGEDVRVRWLRRTRPYAVMVDARFDNLALVFDRMLSPCRIPYGSTITESDGMATWTLWADVGIDGARLEAAGSSGCGDGLGGLDGALDGLRIVLESGTITDAKGFTLKGHDTATIDDEAVEASVNTAGIVELSLSWR